MIVTSQDPSGLAQAVARHLNEEVIQMATVQFADGELHVSLPDPSLVNNKEVTIIQSTGHSVNKMSLGLAFMIQQLKNAGAKKIRTIVPYLGYSRQESSSIAGKPGQAAVLARLLEVAGSDETILVEIHKEQLLSFFTKPVFNISLTSFLMQHIQKNFPDRDRICLIAPDQGAQLRAKEIAELLNIPVITFSKERYAADATRIISSQGSCKGRDAIIIDDIISTGDTAIKAAQKAQELECSLVYGYFVHPVLAANAYQSLLNSSFSKIFVTDTLPLPEEAKDFKLGNKFEVISIAEEIALAISKNRTI